MVLLDIALSILVENRITKKTVINPNTNPTNGNVKLPTTGIVIPVTIIRPAPSDAPEDTPSVYGDESASSRASRKKFPKNMTKSR